MALIDLRTALRDAVRASWPWPAFVVLHPSSGAYRVDLGSPWTDEEYHILIDPAQVAYIRDISILADDCSKRAMRSLLANGEVAGHA